MLCSSLAGLVLTTLVSEAEGVLAERRIDRPRDGVAVNDDLARRQGTEAAAGHGGVGHEDGDLALAGLDGPSDLQAGQHQAARRVLHQVDGHLDGVTEEVERPYLGDDMYPAAVQEHARDQRHPAARVVTEAGQDHAQHHEQRLEAFRRKRQLVEKDEAIEQDEPPRHQGHVARRDVVLDRVLLMASDVPRRRPAQRSRFKAMICRDLGLR